MVQLLLLFAGLIHLIQGIDVCPPAPPFDRSCLARLIIPGCSSDQDCTKPGTKCCKSECNVLQCVESKQGIVKGGICPPLPNADPDFCLTAKFSSDCDGNDANCPGEKKCCPTQCGSQNCRDPITEPRKECPAVDPAIRCIHYYQQCSSDLECPKGDICCHVPCGTGCITPDKQQNLVRCPNGNPLRNIFCGRGPGRQDCPPGYSCNIDPADRFAVCCFNKYVCPLVKCSGSCEYGYVLNNHGCQTCKCKPAPCPLPKCVAPPPSSCTKPDFKIFNGVKCPWCPKIVPCNSVNLYNTTSSFIGEKAVETPDFRQEIYLVDSLK